MATRTEPIRFIKGMFLHFRTERSMAKYNFKTTITAKERKYIEMYNSLCKTDDDAKLLGLILAHDGYYFQTAPMDMCERILKEYNTFFEESYPFKKLLTETENFDILNFMKDGLNGSPALQAYKSKFINPIEFALLLDSTHCDEGWTSLHWRMEKQKINKLREALLSLASYRLLLSKTKDFFKQL